VAGVEDIAAHRRAASPLRRKHWKLPRLSRVDLNVLRLATFELLARPEIPASVTLNERIGYGALRSEDSPSFVNGVLDPHRAASSRPRPEGRRVIRARGVRRRGGWPAAAITRRQRHRGSAGGDDDERRVFGNHSREPARVSRSGARSSEFRGRGPLTVKPDPRATCRLAYDPPLPDAAGASRQPAKRSSSRASIQIAFKLVDGRLGKVLTRTSSLQESLDFAHVERRRHDVAALPARNDRRARSRQMTNVQLRNRRPNARRLLETSRRDVFCRA
jgi:hypothetical protein